MQPDNVNVPAFLSKLWNMVNDPWTDTLISWSTDGKSFIIQNEAQFWYDLLPQYYKHNNMSSFVRQLNMYGFHKKSSVDNGTMDSEKDEIQFFHPYFLKEHPQLLKNIKRKVTGATRVPSTADTTMPTTNWKPEEITKVLTDVKNIKGKQASVDSQLSAMKTENAVLWRELAVLRQKHMTQQKIVNKLIQFLVTIVQPTRMGGLGVKRHYQLMLNDSSAPKKKAKPAPSSSDGPTIHELDTTVPHDILLTENETPVEVFVKSPSTSSQMSPGTSLLEENPQSILMDNVDLEAPSESLGINADDFVNVAELPTEFDTNKDMVLPEFLNCGLMQNEEDINLEEALPIVDEIEGIDSDASQDKKVFLNPSTQDTLLSNLVPGNYNPNAFNGGSSTSKSLSPIKKEQKKATTSKIKAGKKDLTVATREPNIPYSRLNSADDLDIHLESTQSELEQLKDILNGCNTFDANALLGLFSDESLPYELSYAQDTDEAKPGASEGLVSGSELATLASGHELIDFSQLLEDSSDFADNADPMLIRASDLEDLVTPQITSNAVPTFPTKASKSKTKTK